MPTTIHQSFAWKVRVPSPTTSLTTEEAAVKVLPLLEQSLGSQMERVK